MNELEDKKVVIQLKIADLLRKLDENELTYCSKDLKIAIHEIKGLCGLFGYIDLFNLFYKVERSLSENNLLLFNDYINQIDKYKFSNLKKNNAEFSLRNIFMYELCFDFTDLLQLNKIIEGISDCALIVYSKINNNLITIYINSYCDLNTMQLICKPLKITVKMRNKFINRNKCDFLKKCTKNNEYFSDTYLHLFVLESITNFARIANKKFKFTFKSNKFSLNNNFLNDFYVIFAEVIKNVFSHSERKKYEMIKIKCVKKNDVLYIQIYNYGKKIKRKNRKRIFEQGFSTTKQNILSGQGIGLYDVKSLLNNHNGKIYSKNKLKGTAFIMKIHVTAY